MSEGPGGAGEVGKGEPSGDDLVAAFARWAVDERVNDAVRQRTRERWLRQQAVEDATLSGVLTDLAERRTNVVVATRSAQVTGRLLGVAKDFLVVENREGAGALVVTEHVVSISPIARRSQVADPSGDRLPPLSLRLIDALAVLAADRSPVGLGVAGGQTVLGDLIAVGRDVVTLRADLLGRKRGPARPADLYIALAAIEVCTPR